MQKPEAERQRALDMSSALNDAYRTLKDPIKRAQYLLSLEGFDIGEQRSKDVPPELLEEVFELNMALEEMRGGDDSARPQLEQAEKNFAGMLAASDQQLEALFAKYDAAQSRDVLAEIRNVLNRRKYIQNLVSEVEKDLDPQSPTPNPSTLTMEIDFTATGHIVGIDLGTTNSLVAFMDLTGPRIIPGADGDKLVPSVVSIMPGGEVVVGNPARELLITQPERTVYSVKRLMGRGLEDVQGRAEALSVPHRGQAANR